MQKIASKERVQVNMKNEPVRTAKPGALLCASLNSPTMSTSGSPRGHDTRLDLVRSESVFRVHFLPTLGSDDISDKVTEVAARLILRHRSCASSAVQGRARQARNHEDAASHRGCCAR